MALSSKLKKVSILFAILIIPSIAYLILRSGKTNFKVPEIFGPKEAIQKSVNGKFVTDTLYHHIGDFSLISQDSIAVNQSILNNNITVADFFYTSCQSICPELTAKLMQIQHDFADDKHIRLVSFTVDPEHDVPSIMKNYAKQHNAIDSKWLFLTGDKTSINDLARNSFFVSATVGNAGQGDFIVSEKLILIDSKKRIRGYYDGTDFTETDKLKEDIKMLVLEEQRDKENN
jgi:protein SCO1/2